MRVGMVLGLWCDVGIGDCVGGGGGGGVDGG